MKKIMTALALCAAVSAVILSTGCRNHLKDVENTTTDYERKLLRDIPTVESLERNENSAMLRFKVVGNKTSQVKVYQVKNVTARFTPYQWWREFYEVPLGLIIFPLGLCSHALNVATLGLFPYSWCLATDCYGLAALNPFMNNESSSRYDEEPKFSTRDLIDTREETQTYLMRKTMLILKAGEMKRRKTTDDSGIAKFQLLESSGRGLTLDSGEREINLYVGNTAKPSYTRIIPRTLQSRLYKAQQVIKQYNSRKSGANLAKCITTLEKLDFPNISYYLERKELNEHKNIKNFRKEFEAALAK